MYVERATDEQGKTVYNIMDIDFEKMQLIKQLMLTYECALLRLPGAHISVVNKGHAHTINEAIEIGCRIDTELTIKDCKQ